MDSKNQTIKAVEIKPPVAATPAPTEASIIAAALSALPEAQRSAALAALAALDNRATFAALAGKGWAVGPTGAWRGPKGVRCALQIHVGTPGRGNMNIPPEVAASLAEASDGLPASIRERIVECLRDPGVPLFWIDAGIAARYGASATSYARPSKGGGWVKIKDENETVDDENETVDAKADM